MEKQYQEQKNAEIALLQTQINPHFIYNTLDSIQWMAKIQNNPSIVDITRRLTNLLRNSAAGMNADGSYAKITLEEELLLLDDYAEIMLVRFMGSFEVVYHIDDSALHCLIPRLTLQPHVENANRHGIQPGKFGVITVSAFCENAYLTIIVEDNGAGISEEQLETLKTHKAQRRRDKKSSSSLNSIGVANVDERLKLLYGESCGLFFESRLGEYTKVKVKIAEERS
jgi:two-component system sensor histidine kinase YesM